MKTIKNIQTTVDELEFCYFDEEKDEFVEITAKSEVTLEQLQSAMQFFTEEVKRTVNEDLVSIWERLDRLEK